MATQKPKPSKPRKDNGGGMGCRQEEVGDLDFLKELGQVPRIPAERSGKGCFASISKGGERIPFPPLSSKKKGREKLLDVRRIP